MNLKIYVFVIVFSTILLPVFTAKAEQECSGILKKSTFTDGYVSMYKFRSIRGLAVGQEFTIKFDNNTYALQHSIKRDEIIEKLDEGVCTEFRSTGDGWALPPSETSYWNFKVVKPGLQTLTFTNKDSSAKHIIFNFLVKP